MTLGDLLDELRRNILHDRSDRTSDSDSDELWSDETLIRYINQAQRRFARRSLILRDGSTPDITQVKLVAGQNTYTLDKRVVAVISARISTSQVDLPRAGHSLLGAYASPDGRTLIDASRYQALPPGQVLVFSTDEEITADDDGRSGSVTLRMYPTPTAAYASLIQLRVVRLPCPLTPDDLDQECEIPEDYQLDMLDWAAYLAMRMVDLDTGEAGDAMARAQSFATSFENHVKSAQREAMKKLFTPQVWGFGRNGFTWER